MFRIGKAWTFDAAHRLDGLPPGHKCARLHGHTWRVEVILHYVSLTPPGFVVDFGELAPFGAYLKAELDHRCLNDVLDLNPTSEVLAQHLAGWFLENMPLGIADRLAAVRVSETASSWAEFQVAAA